MTKPTIYDMAKRARVSIATVSRALNPATQSLVAPATRERIARLTERSRYAPSLAARSLGRASYHTIGVVVPHRPGLFSSHYYSQILNGVADALFLENRYRFKLILLKFDGAPWDRYNIPAAEGVDGLVITHWRSFFARPTVFQKLGVPCAVISDPEPRLHAHCATGDHALGGRLAAQHLVERGHRRIAIMTGPPHSADSRLRVRGCVAALREHRVSVPREWILQGEFHEEPTVPVALAFFKRYRGHVTAMFCCNDNMAFGVLRACAQLGVRCPQDLSLVGYDNEPRGERSKPPLTTIDVPLYELARDATVRLLTRLTSGGSSDEFFRPALNAVALIERQSVRTLR